jgi:hypothetical protein
VPTANGHAGPRRTSWTIVITRPMSPTTNAIISAVPTAVTAPSTLQVSGGQ